MTDENENPSQEEEKTPPAKSPEDLDADTSVSEEWIGEEEWGDEEDEEELLEEAAPTFVDNGDGTVSDTRNSLMWKKNDSFAEYEYGITWYEAHDYCEALNEKKFAGYDDWRLHSDPDATSIFSFTKTNYDKDGAEIHIDSEFEPNGGHNTWTYEEKPDYPQYAQKFSYVTGNDTWEHKDNEYSHVRVVRDIPKDDWEPEWRKESKQFER